MEKRKYKRLHYEDRQTIEAMSKQGSSVKDIAEALGTHRDTIYREFKRCCLRCRYYDICRWDVLGNAGLQSEETITLLAIENSKPHKDGLLFRICQYVEFKQRARRENEKL